MFNRKKFPEDDLHELFPEGSGDLASDQFEPGWFLLEHHHGTSFDDLRVGLGYLRRKVESQKEGQLSFLKVNTGAKQTIKLVNLIQIDLLSITTFHCNTLSLLNLNY